MSKEIRVLKSRDRVVANAIASVGGKRVAEKRVVSSSNPIVSSAIRYRTASNASVSENRRLRDLRPGEKLRVGQEIVAMGPHGTVDGTVASVSGDRFKIRLEDGSVYCVEFGMKDVIEVGNACCENAFQVKVANAVNLGFVTLKSPEAEEVQKLARTKGYAAAKKYCTEKKDAIERVDGHRAWYFLDAALDAGKMTGMNAVPVDGSYTPMAYIKGLIRAIEANPSKKDEEGGAWSVVREKPNYKALSASPEYRKLDKLMGINATCDGEQCAVENAKFKVGDKVKLVDGWIRALDGKVGTVVKNPVPSPINGPRYTVKIDGEDMEVGERILLAANAECCNAFREGQSVTIRGIEAHDMRGTIVKKAPNGWWVSWGIDKSGVIPEKYLVPNAECCNAQFKVGDRVRYYHGGNTPFKVVKIEGSTYFVAPDDKMFGVEDGVPAPASKLTPLNAVCNFDVKTPGAQAVVKAIAAIPGGPSALRKGQALEIQKKTNASDKDFDAALRFFQFDGIADVRNEEVVRNSVGDCYADATFCIERAIKNPKSARSELAKAKQEIAGSYGVMSYDGTGAKDKATVGVCVAAIDKAMGNPTSDNLMAARWECEKGRAQADGGTPQRSLWS